MAQKPKTVTQKAMTKSQLYTEISNNTGLTKKQVASVFDELTSVVERHVRTRAVGTFTLPGLLKIKSVKVPAKKARKGVMVLGQLRDIPAKPATTKVRVTPLKALKQMAL